MGQATDSLGEIVDSSKRFAHQLLTIGENRFDLLMVEVQEEREHRLHEISLALAVALSGFLALLALNVAIVIIFWKYSPVGVLLALAVLYAAIAIGFYNVLTRLQRDWKMFSASLDQLRKDRECLEKKIM